MPTPEQSPQVKIQYVDRPDVAETFADSIENVHFDGLALRIEFCVTRMDNARPKEALTGRRYPACRIVLSAPAAVDLINRMQQVGSALQQAGILKPAPPQVPSTHSKA